MSKPVPKLSELQVFYGDFELIEKVVEQIKKDFNWFNFNIEFDKNSDDTPYMQLYGQILPKIDELLNDDYPKLLAMLYRIDIDEEFLNRQLKSIPNADTDEIISDIIIKRELQKVIIRQLYSQ